MTSPKDWLAAVLATTFALGGLASTAASAATLQADTWNGTARTSKGGHDVFTDGARGTGKRDVFTDGARGTGERDPYTHGG
ncbi:hypothetical protein K6V92_13435 [Cupriavidus respiraculi]|uniref:hypothetical protein n=1 Tax=Cupriavidus respiraculi TaxID=195930 RepID=UPI001C98C898|nr:hypothetical protein [Cupriavidus respiraculi]MBY4947621.1 hypothetical protein [Cupriavidus respiraculi]